MTTMDHYAMYRMYDDRRAEMEHEARQAALVAEARRRDRRLRRHQPGWRGWLGRRSKGRPLPEAAGRDGTDQRPSDAFVLGGR